MSAGVVLVTGCSSGIGRASASAFQDAGWITYATARNPATLTALEAAGVFALRLDVIDETSMQQAVSAIEARHGAVDVLVNNAGYALQAPIETADMAQVRRQFDTNVFGLVRLTQLVLPAMRAQRSGRIVNVSSMAGRLTFPGGGFYHATKHAVEAISDALRLETAPFGIRISVVQPGPVLTDFGTTAVSTIAEDGSRSSEPYDDFMRRVAVAYAGAYDEKRRTLASSPEAVARVILRAATARRPRARYVVGPLARTLLASRRVLPDRAFDALVKAGYPTP
ncbi:MAG: oxidoreductase [Nocardioidaceae bacterium]